MSIRYTNTNLTIDFQKDWSNIMRNQLARDGYKVNSDEKSLEICIKYLNLFRRRIISKPRTILISKEFHCPKNCREGVKLIRRKVKTGQDLTPHLSRQITNIDYNDALLNDWDIFHFHLGTSPDKNNSGFIARTGPLLFSRVTNDYFYMIDICKHGDWSKQKLIEIVHRNWPESITDYKISGVSCLTHKNTDDDIKDLRAKGISTVFQVDDGTVYTSIGGGYDKSGANMDIVVRCKSCASNIRKWEEYIKDHLSKLVDIALQQGIILGSHLHFQLEIRDGNAYAIEVISGFILPLGKI